MTDPSVGGRFSRRSLLRGAGALALLASAGGLTACGGGPGGRTNIRFFESKRETIKYFTQVAADFNANQQTYFSAIENSDDKKLVADFVRGTQVQIGLSNYNLAFGGYVRRGVLTDQADNPLIKNIRPDVIAFSQEFGKYRSEISAIPYSMAASGVIYNRDLFDKAGVTIPTTWSQFADVCEKLKSKDITPLLTTWTDTWTISQHFFDYVAGGLLNVGKFFADLNALGSDFGPNSPVTFTKDFAPTLAKMAEVKNEWWNADRKQIAYDQGNRDFAAGKAAMYLQGPWAYTGIAKANPDLKCGMFPLPVKDDEKDLKAWVNLDLVVWTPRADTGALKAGGQTFAEWLMKPEVMHKYNADNLAFSPDIAAPVQDDPKVANMNQYVQAGRIYQGAHFYFPKAIPLERYLQAYVYGSMPAETVLANLDRDWKRLATRIAA